MNSTLRGSSSSPSNLRENFALPDSNAMELAQTKRFLIGYTFSLFVLSTDDKRYLSAWPVTVQFQIPAGISLGSIDFLSA